MAQAGFPEFATDGSTLVEASPGHGAGTPRALAWDEEEIRRVEANLGGSLGAISATGAGAADDLREPLRVARLHRPVLAAQLVAGCPTWREDTARQCLGRELTGADAPALQACAKHVWSGTRSLG